MNCERCSKFRRIVSFYDDQTDSTVTLCESCFKWFANGRRKGGLPVPNTRSVTRSIRHLVKASMALCLVLGLAACSDDNGGDQVNAQGVQKCTVTMNGKEQPCH